MVVEGAVKREVTQYLLTIMTLDRLTEDSEFSEEDAMRLSKAIKSAVRERWDAESGR